MVTGNFALLIGADPAEVHRWYLEVYVDAYEWVELPNTLGMSQFGDGGLLGSKPYISSGAYIDRMSDYCGQCRYDVKKRVGEDACRITRSTGISSRGTKASLATTSGCACRTRHGRSKARNLVMKHAPKLKLSYRVSTHRRRIRLLRHPGTPPQRSPSVNVQT